jgi:hypothetical protein
MRLCIRIRGCKVKSWVWGPTLAQRVVEEPFVPRIHAPCTWKCGLGRQVPLLKDGGLLFEHIVIIYTKQGLTKSWISILQVE